MGGALAAIVVGTLTYGSGGLPNAAVLLAFFFSSVVLSSIGRARKKRLVDLGKTGARDGAQVLANGLVASVCALLALTASPLWQLGFLGAFAAATADTWATEIGTLTRGLPRSVLTGKPVPTGISGGITYAGTVAALFGALFIATVAYFVHASHIIIAVAAGGLTGAFVDSLLGATLQSLRYCTGCARLCETERHVCGADTTLVRGASWMSNDAVNFAATLAGAGTAMALASFKIG